MRLYQHLVLLKLWLKIFIVRFPFFSGFNNMFERLKDHSLLSNFEIQHMKLKWKKKIWQISFITRSYTNFFINFKSKDYCQDPPEKSDNRGLHCTSCGSANSYNEVEKAGEILFFRQLCRITIESLFESLLENDSDLMAKIYLRY